MLPRMEALKGIERAGEKGGDLKPGSNSGEGGNAASLAGKDGAAVKQEVQMHPSTRPAPASVASSQAVPAHAAQAGTGGTFRVLHDAVHMRIQDEELGPMRWHIHLSGGKISAEAIVETARVQELLQTHREVLEAQLNAVGVEVGGFDVSVDKGSQRFEALSEPDDSGRGHTSNDDRLRDASINGILSIRRQDQRLDLYV